MHRRPAEIRPIPARFLGLLFAGLILLVPMAGAIAQPQPVSQPASQPSPPATASDNEDLILIAAQAATWNLGQTGIVQLTGPVRIELRRAHLSADSAVVWISPLPNALLGEKKVEIALIGHATLAEPGIAERSADTLFVDGQVQGAIQLVAKRRSSENLSHSEIYRRAHSMRPALLSRQLENEDQDWILSQGWLPPSTNAPATGPATQPTTQPTVTFPIHYNADHIVTPDQKIDGKIAVVLQGHVTLLQNRENGEYFQMRADRAVLYTSLHTLSEGQRGVFSQFYDVITSAYLEGDVRIVHMPPGKQGGEERLLANQVYYDFQADRAILTQAVLHSVDALDQQPFVMRANVIRQLSLGEFTAEKAQVTSSSFHTPSFSMNVDKLYVRQIDTGDPRYGTYTTYTGHDATFDSYDVPFFYTPYTAGTYTERGQLLRSISIENSSYFGESVLTEWGLLETLGQIPPANRQDDITYGINYFSYRGPSVDLNAKYADGFITPITKQPWSYEGALHGIFVEDRGDDNLGNDRDEVIPPTQNRGRFEFSHQQFLPDNWQVQVAFSWFSDPTFNEEYYQDEFDSDSPRQASFYAKQQQDTQAITFTAAFQPNRFVTNADSLQENFEVEQLPEIGFRRLGDSLAGGNVVFFSQNTLDTLYFHRSAASLVTDWGFDPNFGGPGEPALGTTGTTGQGVYRGDTRQEFDMPVTIGRFRVVPYIFGRYTGYSASPADGGQNRLFVGTGARITTEFWRVDDTVESDLWDLHRLRHVIEPQINVFTSAESVDRSHLYQFDQDVDEINNISAVQLALNQRWQTKRGGPGRWRSVDVFTWNIQANFFANKPRDPLITPTNFRGLFFFSEPEASIPRNSINSDFTWRISDTTAVLGDAEYNADAHDLATASIGVAVRRDQRLAYFLGQRYINDLDSNITTLAANYELTPKYTLSFRQSFDFGVKQNVGSNFAILRQLDRYVLEFDLHYDAVRHDSGFGIGFYPQDFMAAGFSSADAKSVFSP